jgi:hypothetical protein
MSDTLYQSLVPLLPLIFAVGIEVCGKSFRETRRYRAAVLVCGFLFSAITYAEMERERRKAIVEREAAIQETSERVAVRTSASVSDVLGRQFAETLSEVRNMKLATIASTAEVHALFAETQTGKQKRQDVKEQLRRYVGMSNWVLVTCKTVSPPGRGGTNAQVCINDARAWVLGPTGYISGSLGELYLNRFGQAGLPGNTETPSVTGVDPTLDRNTASEVYWAIHELEAKINVLNEFIKELDK